MISPQVNVKVVVIASVVRNSRMSALEQVSEA